MPIMKDPSNDSRVISEHTIKRILEIYESKRWYEIAFEKPGSGLKFPKSPKNLSVYDICKLGKELMNCVSKKYVSIACKNDSEERWLHISAEDPFIYRRDNKKSSTFSDKIDSMAVLIHNNCVFNWKMFSQLLNLVKSDKIRVKSSCLELMYSSFMEILPVRKLRYLNQIDKDILDLLSYKLLHFSINPNSSWDTLEFPVLNLLLAISFEDYLKGIYSSFIQELSDIMNRGIEFLQKNASNLALQMLIQKSEQEEILLDLIINRLNHKDNKMSSYVFKMLDTLLLNHEKMKGVVVERITSQMIALTNKFRNEIGNTNSLEDVEIKRKRKKRKKNYISNEVIHTLKTIYRCILYISKLKYSKNEVKIVDSVIKNNISMLLLFISTPSDTINSKTKKMLNSKSFSLNSGLYKYEECSRIIKILLEFLNKLVNFYKKLDKYDQSVRPLVSSDLSKNLYKLSYKTRSISINVLLLVLLYNLEPINEEYYRILSNMVFNIKLYESTSFFKFLELVKEIFKTPKEYNLVLSRKLIQATLFNYNSNINYLIIKITKKHVEKSKLWELFLHNSSFNPYVTSAIKSIEFKKESKKRKLEDEKNDLELGRNSLYDELTIFSGCLQHKYEYTLEKYWTHNKVCKPHQRVFQLYYQSKSKLTNKKSQEKDLEDKELDKDEDFGDFDDEDYEMEELSVEREEDSGDVNMGTEDSDVDTDEIEEELSLEGDEDYEIDTDEIEEELDSDEGDSGELSVEEDGQLELQSETDSGD